MKDLKEAEHWLNGAKHLLTSKEADPEKYTVIAAMPIHSIIKSNDALTLKFLKRRAMRHDQSITLFQQLIRENKIPPEFSNLRNILMEGIQNKSKADYKGAEITKSKAERWIKNAEKFYTKTKELLKDS